MGESLFPNAPHNNWMSWYATTDNGGEITPIPKSGTYSLHVAGCILYESAGDPTIHLTAFTGLILPKRNTGGPYFDTAKTRYEVNEIGFTLLTTIGQDAK